MSVQQEFYRRRQAKNGIVEDWFIPASSVYTKFTARPDFFNM